MWVWKMMLLIIIALLSQNLHGCRGCWEEERAALLQLKVSINYPNGTSLPSWEEHINRSNCCSWEGISCDSNGRVVFLELDGARNGPLSDGRLNLNPSAWKLNASVLVPLQELTYLDLSSNSLVDWTEDKGCERLSAKLKNLEVLYLIGNKLHNSVLTSMGALPSLRELYLGDNNLTGSIDLKGIEPLEELQLLYLSGNRIASITSGSGSPILKKLKSLDLSESALDTSTLSSLSAFPSLMQLYLNDCKNLTGSIHLDDLKALQNLEELYLTNTGVNGFTTTSTGSGSPILKKLKILDLSESALDTSALSSLSAFPSLTQLYLYGCDNLTGSIHLDDLKALQNLEELYLSYTGVNGFRASSTGSGSPILKKLKILTLSESALDTSALSFLSAFPSLTQLDLHGCKNLTGSIHLDDLKALQNLEELDLSYTRVNGFKTTSTGSGSPMLKKLKILKLSYTVMNINALSSLSSFSSLRQLFLSHCDRLNGSIHLDDLEALQNLEVLDLSHTGVNGFTTISTRLYNFRQMKKLNLQGCPLNQSLLHGLGMMTSLKMLRLGSSRLDGQLINYGWLGLLRNLQVLDLSQNLLHGNIAVSPLTNLTSLECLWISENNFDIPFPSFISSFANHSKLKLFLSDNNKVILTSESPSIISKFQLQVLTLSNCSISGRLLYNFLSHQHDLRVLDLSHNNLQGKFPAWLLENNTGLLGLDLSNNLLAGPFSLPLHSLANFSALHVSKNEMDGAIPGNISLTFPFLCTLDMSSNAFEGNIPSSFWDLKQLLVLNLSDNHLSGRLPGQHLIEGFSIQFLDISHNNLDGPVSFLSNASDLSDLHLEGNRFSGRLPISWSSSLIRALNMSNNNFSGGLPGWVNLPNLRVLDLSNNHLNGRTPDEYCDLPSLLFMDLSDNYLSGSVLSCFGPQSISHLQMRNNRLSGPIPDAFNISNHLVLLDLSYNYLNGSIPNWICNSKNLSVLLLRSNSFEGGIPKELCDLKQLSMLDLSNNYFSGPIPSCIKNISLHPVESKACVLNEDILMSSPWWMESGASLLDDFENSEQMNNSLEAFISDFEDITIPQIVEFTTKGRAYLYKGVDLQYMTGIDLSCNKLTGEIPSELGSLSQLHALNLSHNNLTGSIPITFSKLSQIESLDLSYNYLTGSIPAQLVDLTYLEVFSVAHNNLSGRIPDFENQFGTFNESSYEGNPLLCGLPLHSCLQTEKPSSTPPTDQDSEDGGWIDMSIFYTSFGVSFAIMFLVAIAVMVINPRWLQTWSYLLEVCFNSIYCFSVVNFKKLERKVRHAFGIGIGF